MEVSGVVLRRIPCVSSFVADGRYSDLRSGFSGETRSVEFRSRRFRGITCDFADKGHRSYYLDPARCDGGGGEKGKVNIMEKKKKKEKEKEKEMKKKAKALKSLCKNLNMLTSIGFGLIDPEAEIQNKTISEATEILVKKIEKLKTEEKLLKKQKKEEKAKAMKLDSESSSSSSSSESSDSDCDKGNKVVDMMASFRNKAKPILEPLQQQSNVATLPKELEDGETLKLMASSMVFPSMASHGHMLNTIEAVTPLKRVVEVCMGGKCKKLGGALLLDEFQKAAMNTGMEGSAVVACKCMGKCREGPNVRVVNEADDVMADSVRTPSKNKTVCVGVGLQDVEAIVTSFFGEEECRSSSSSSRGLDYVSC